MRTRIPQIHIERARRLRNEPTKAEGLLWWKLRQLNRRGCHFRRQAPFKGYFLDFVEYRAKLVIELDGSQHGLARQREHDARRDGMLRNEGYIVLRFANLEVFDDLDRVVEAVWRSVAEPRPPTRKIAPRFSDLPTRGR